MKFSSKKSKFLIIIIGILVILSLNFYQKVIKNFFYFISAPIQKTLWRTGDKVSDFFETTSEIKNLKKDNEELKLKIQELLAKNAEVSILKEENKFLREALDIGLEKEFDLIMAEVLGKDIWQDSLVINKGSKDGIAKNLPVITQQKTLIGKTGEVYENFSRVILISNKDSAFNAQISRDEEGFAEDISGAVKGRGNFQLFLDLIPKEKEIKEGDLIITTSFGGGFPKGLLVGQIQTIKKSDIEPFQQAEIKPAFGIKELEAVFIIKYPSASEGWR